MYLVVRVNPYISSALCYVLSVLAVMTIFIAGLGAIFENDVKRVIALSTLRQLGLMMRVLGLGGGSLAFYHLIIHAIFKSLIFMCAGFLIHQVSGAQDLRMLGGVGLYCPLVCLCLNVSSAALCGIPFMSGFYSRDLIIDLMTASGGGLGLFWVFMASCGLTAAYSFRIAARLGVSTPGYRAYESLGDLPRVIRVPILCLAVGGVAGGALTFWVLFSDQVHVLGAGERALILVLVGGGAIAGLLMRTRPLGAHSAELFSSSMWNLPSLTVSLVRPPLIWGQWLTVSNEHGWDELIGGQGASRVASGGALLQAKYMGADFKSYLAGALI